jgi:hypothetical protein
MVAEDEEDKVLYLGLVGAGNLLEIVTVKRDGDSDVVIHGVPMRRIYENCCVRQVKTISDKDSGRSKTGIELTPDVLNPMCQEVEAGLDVAKPRPRSGGPAMGSGPAAALPVRLDPELRCTVHEPAAIENTALSEVMREALRRDLKTRCGPCRYPLQNRSFLREAVASLKDRRRAGSA